MPTKSLSPMIDPARRGAFSLLIGALDKQAVQSGEEGDWVPSTSNCALSVLLAGELAPTLFCTKPHVLRDSSELLAPYNLVGRMGVLGDAERALLRRAFCHGTLMFLGDLDPQDLSSFASIAMYIPAQYVGVGGMLLEGLQSRGAKLPFIRMSAFERETWASLKACIPELRSTIGSAAVEVLDGGRKLELEGVTRWGHLQALASQLAATAGTTGGPVSE